MSLIPAGNDNGTALAELPTLLKAWMKLQEEILTMNAELLQRKKHSKALRDTILRIMESNKVAALNVSRGVISHRVREKPEPVNASYLLKQCTTFFEGDEAKAKALVEFLETKREVKQQHDLKLTMPKSEGDELSRRS
jgi:hypothetical protein